MFAINFFYHLQNVKKHSLLLITIILAMVITEIVVSVMSYIFHGSVTIDYLVTGMVASILTASVVSGITIYLLEKLSQQRRDNDQLTEIINACPIPIGINDAQQNIVMINREFTKVYGYTVDDIATLEDWWTIAYPDEDYRQSVRELWGLRLKGINHDGSGFTPLKVKVNCKNGELKSVMATACPLGELHKDINLVVLYDITESSSISQAIAVSHNILQSVIETIPFRVFWKDKDLRYLGCNTAFANDAGQICPDGIIGKLDSELTWKDQAELYQADDHDVIQSGQAKLAFEEPQSTPKGDKIWLRTSKLPLHDTTGDILGLLGIYEDITHQKKIENELGLSKTFIEKSKTAFYRLSPTGQVLYVNEYACRSLGYTKDELVGMYPWEFDPDFPASEWPNVWNKLLKNEVVNIETRHRRKDGNIFDVDVTGHYISVNGEEFSFTFVQDITDRKQAEKALRQKEGYQQALLDNFPFEVWLKDTDSRFLAVNQLLSDSLGSSSKDDLIGKNDFDIASHDLAELYRKDDCQVMESRQQKIVEEIVAHDKNIKWVETFKAPVIDKAGELLGTVGFSRNISERKAIEAELRVAAIAFESQEGMIITDANNIILKINQSFTNMTGYTEKEAVGQKMHLLKSGIQDASFYAEMWRSINNTGSWQGEIWNRRKNGEIYPEWLTITAVMDEDGIITHYVGTMLDITDRKAIERKIQHLAHHDALTDLPNRTLLTDRLNQALAQVRRQDTMLALMFIDLDKFKPVNDILGHDIGDWLLKEVAGRLFSCVKRESDTVSRIGGDEFVVLLSRIEDEGDVEIIAKNILDAISQPFNIQQHSINISSSIGIAFYPKHGVDAISLMKNADNAMYHAKESGRNCFRFFTEDKNKLQEVSSGDY
jgi:diguanylate cyclase (GGDEF)-like protein/PAS domain S-box-containing protein